RTQAADPVAPARGDHVADRGRRQSFRAEVVAVAAVDLQVEQGRGHPASLVVRAWGRARPDRVNQAARTDDFDRFSSGIMTGPDTDGKFVFGSLCRNPTFSWRAGGVSPLRECSGG